MLTGSPTERLESLQQDIKFINSLLVQMGLESPFPFGLSPSDLQQGALTSAALHNMEAACRILITLLNSKQNKFYGKLEASEKELRSAQQQQRESLARITQLERTAQSATDEVNRLRSAFQLKQKQFNNELRKREREFERLREQLQGCLKEPGVSAASLTRAENIFDVSTMRAALSTTATNEAASAEEMLSEDHAAPSKIDRMTLLEHENANLRQLLISVSQILGEMRYTVQQSSGQAGEELQEPLDLAASLSTMPVQLIYDQVKEEIEVSLAVLGEHLGTS